MTDRITASLSRLVDRLFSAVNPTAPYKPRKLLNDPYHTALRRARKLRPKNTSKEAQKRLTRKKWVQKNRVALKKRSEFVRKQRKARGLD